jgi:hypothetical protein
MNISLSTDNRYKNIYTVTEEVVIEVRAIDFYIFFFCVLQKTKTSEHSTKIGRVFLLCMCSFFSSFFPDVLRHHHLLLLLLPWLRLQQSASSSSSLLFYYARSLRSCHHHSLSHSFIHSFTSMHSSSHLAIRQRTEIINKVF